jgi:glycosyltransferase involved in cell wall biosynthesis
MISVLVLTKDEEQDLPGCLKSVRWSDDVHIFDSYSTDRTLEIAKQSDAHIIQRHFDNWSSHQNWALANISFRHPWIFYIDADERVTPQLASSIQQAVCDPGDKVAFRVRRRDFWGDRWLKHVQASSYYVRLFRPERMRYERLVNPVSIPDGPVGELSGYLDHYPFSKGMTHWLSRHNSYSSLEARQIVTNRERRQRFSFRQALFAKDRNQRRFHQKELFYRLPARPFIKFLLLYVAKRGFLDGRAGFHYAMLQSFYEYMILRKTKELADRVVTPVSVAQGVPSPNAVCRNLHANPRSND